MKTKQKTVFFVFTCLCVFLYGAAIAGAQSSANEPPDTKTDTAADASQTQKNQTGASSNKSSSTNANSNANEAKKGKRFLNPWFDEASFSFDSGFIYGDMSELVYAQKSDGTYTRLSKLDWDLHFLWTIAVNASFDIKRMRIACKAQTVLPVSGSGFMQDRDWKNLDDTLTDFSEHPVRTEGIFNGDILFAYKILDVSKLSTGSGAGFQFMTTALCAHDGYKENPGQARSSFTGDVILYRQDLYLPYLASFVQWKAHPNFDLTANLCFIPVSVGAAQDTHYNTAISAPQPVVAYKFFDRMYGWASVKGELNLRFSLPSANEAFIRHALELRINGIFINEMTGSSYKKTGNVLYNTAGKPGATYRSFGISLAYCMRIR